MNTFENKQESLQGNMRSLGTSSRSRREDVYLTSQPFEQQAQHYRIKITDYERK